MSCPLNLCVRSNPHSRRLLKKHPRRDDRLECPLKPAVRGELQRHRVQSGKLHPAPVSTVSVMTTVRSLAVRRILRRHVRRTINRTSHRASETLEENSVTRRPKVTGVDTSSALIPTAKVGSLIEGTMVLRARAR
jgi:hypothetical protein